MLNLDLTTLRLFVAVCEAGNMSHAAASLGMGASAISKRLAQLEQTTGADLLVRRRHGVAPTPAGKAVLDHARSILLAASRIERDLAGMAAGVQGRVNCLATASAMAEALADDISDFLKLPAHQNIRIDLEERVSPDVVRGIREGTASLGVCWDAADTEGLQTHTWRHDHLCVAVPQGHALTRQGAVRYADTLAYEQVIMPINSAVEVMLQREAGKLGRSLNYRVIVTNFEAALRVVRAGLAIAIVPREVTGSFAEPWGLQLLPLHEAWSRRRFIVCHRGTESLAPPARLLLDHLRAVGAGSA